MNIYWLKIKNRNDTERDFHHVRIKLHKLPFKQIVLRSSTPPSHSSTNSCLPFLSWDLRLPSVLLLPLCPDICWCSVGGAAGARHAALHDSDQGLSEQDLWWVLKPDLCVASDWGSVNKHKQLLQHQRRATSTHIWRRWPSGDCVTIWSPDYRLIIEPAGLIKRQNDDAALSLPSSLLGKCANRSNKIKAHVWSLTWWCLFAGLCGNFNNNQADDFLKLSGVPDATAAGFANSWKTHAGCHEVKSNFDHPCSVSVDNGRSESSWRITVGSSEWLILLCQWQRNTPSIGAPCWLTLGECSPPVTQRSVRNRTKRWMLQPAIIFLWTVPLADLGNNLEPCF